MTKDYLQAVREREQRATPGPWELVVSINREDEPEQAGESRYSDIGPISSCDSCPIATPEDARFVSHARKDIPNLLDYIDRLERALAKCKDQRGEYFGYYPEWALRKYGFTEASDNAELDEILKGEK